MIRIAITGPESSGKTTIATQLAKRLSGCLVLEYAREYLVSLKEKSYTIDDVLNIGRFQFNANKASDCHKDYVICDTEMSVIKIWCEDKFGYCPQEIEALFVAQQFDFIFLCKPDMTWQADPLREDAFRRDDLFKLYIRTLDKAKVPYDILRGSKKERLVNILSKIGSNNNDFLNPA